jgi:hypothetical protein
VEAMGIEPASAAFDRSRRPLISTSCPTYRVRGPRRLVDSASCEEVRLAVAGEEECLQRRAWELRSLLSRHGEANGSCPDDLSVPSEVSAYAYA